MKRIRDATEIVTVPDACRQLVVSWRACLAVSGPTGALGLTLDDGPVVGQCCYAHEASGSVVLVRGVFMGVSAGVHVVQGVGEDVEIISQEMQAVTVT